MSGGETAELLLRALGDDDWRVRKEAAAISPSIDRRDEIVAALVTALEETVNIGLRNAAVEALVAIGPDAIRLRLERSRGSTQTRGSWLSRCSAA